MRWARQSMTVVGARLVMELRGVSCQPLEAAPPAKKSITTSRSFPVAVSECVKWFCPDVSTTLICTPDELGAQVDGESGEVIEAGPVRPVAYAQPARQDEENETGEALAERDAARETREQLLEHVIALCVELGYDTKLQFSSRAKAAKMSDEDIRTKAIGSLDRLIAQKRGELSRQITAELERMEPDAGQMAGYVGANGGQGEALEDCSLSELRLVADSLELL